MAIALLSQALSTRFTVRHPRHLRRTARGEHEDKRRAATENVFSPYMRTLGGRRLRLASFWRSPARGPATRSVRASLHRPTRRPRHLKPERLLQAGKFPLGIADSDARLMSWRPFVTGRTSLQVLGGSLYSGG